MTSGSFGMSSRVSSLLFQSFFSVVSCWSVDSMFTSIGFVLMFSPVFISISSLRSFSRWDKESAAVFIFPGIPEMSKLNCKTKLQAVHEVEESFFFGKIW